MFWNGLLLQAQSFRFEHVTLTNLRTRSAQDGTQFFPLSFLIGLRLFFTLLTTLWVSIKVLKKCLPSAVLRPTVSQERSSSLIFLLCGSVSGQFRSGPQWDNADAEILPPPPPRIPGVFKASHYLCSKWNLFLFFFNDASATATGSVFMQNMQKLCGLFNFILPPTSSDLKWHDAQWTSFLVVIWWLSFREDLRT